MRKILLITIILVTIFLRIYKIDKNPPSLFSDEVDLGYQAYSFLNTGRDYFGNFLPISFRSVADYRAPLYIYSAIPTIKIFGLNELGVRLPAVIFGILGLGVFFLLIKQISENEEFSLISTLILAISPWHFHYSRVGFEVSALFFIITLSLYLFFKSVKKQSFRIFLLSTIIACLSFYTYATARLLTPLIGFIIVIIYRKDILKFGLKKILITLFVCFIVLIPFVKDSVLGGAFNRFSYLNIFSDSNLKFEINRERLVDTTHNQVQEPGMKPTITSYIFHNKPFSWSLKIIENYVSSFSSSFLFLKGDPNIRHGIGRMGNLLVITLPFLLLGFNKILTIIFKKENGLIDKKQSLVILMILLLSPLPASITFDGGTHSSRLFMMILPLIILISLGFWELILLIQKRLFKNILFFGIILLLIFNFTYYLHLYFYHYGVESEKYWHVGMKEGILEVLKFKNDYDKIIITSSYEPPLLFFLFWSKYDPKNFRFDNMPDINTDAFQGKKLDKYYFGRVGTGMVDLVVSEFKKNNFDKILILAQRNDLGSDLEKEIPKSFVLIKKIKSPTDQTIFYLLRTKTYNEYKLETIGN